MSKSQNKQNNPQATALKALITSDSCARLDKGELIKSQTLRDIAEFSIAHYLAHGDRTYLLKILGIFQRSKYYRPVLMWLCDACGLKYSVHKGNVLFFRRKAGPSELGSIDTYLQQYSGSLRNVVTDAPKKSKPKKSAKSIDMLDSRARVSGCYGAGKRR